MDLRLTMAEQQLTGFVHCYDGGDIITLVAEMGLSLDEWLFLKENDEITYLSDDFVSQIDNYFDSK
jgi:hypothetical protein